MAKKAQVLMLVLWILVFISLLTVTTGHRVSLALRLSRFQRDKLKTYCLAKAGVEKTIVELKQDQNEYDSLDEAWNTPLENTEIKEGSGETFTTRMLDEERKININTASQELLVTLLEHFEVANETEIAYNIRAFRGDADASIPEEAKDYQALGYTCKGDKFANTAELMLVKEITPEVYQKLKDSITVFGYGRININTSSPEILKSLARSVAQKLLLADSFADSVAEKLIDSRNRRGPFKSREGIQIELTGDEETNIFNNLLNEATFNSSNFLIEATGNLGKIKSVVWAVYNRNEQKLLYWHES